MVIYKALAYIIADGSVNTVHIEHSNTRWSKPAKVDQKVEAAVTQ